MVYTVCMDDLIKRPTYGDFELGDIVRCTAAVRGSKGRRFNFLGAVFESEDADTPAYFDLADIRSGNLRAIPPQHVIKDVKASKAAQARRAKAAAAREAAADARAERRATR